MLHLISHAYFLSRILCTVFASLSSSLPQPLCSARRDNHLKGASLNPRRLGHGRFEWGPYRDFGHAADGRRGTGVGLGLGVITLGILLLESRF
jgi:hypothetical protein